MKFTRSCILIFVILIIGTTACKKDSDLPPEDVGYSFFPYTPGSYLIYQVDSTRYDDFYDTVTTTSFQLKELYESWFTDAQGRPCIRIERWLKLSDTTDWYLRDVWYSCLTSSFAERVEENVRFTRLAFPVRNSTEWDGNAFNENEAQIFEYDEIDEPYASGLFSFDSTVTVLQEISSNLIEEKNQYEIYARHVGLVYKKYKDVEKDFVSGSIVAGVDYSWQLIEYGHN
ncbi:MAG: hypothetical protein A2W93_00120 [Bacteroidetes bacterium GWF2_43_63]|nr:MAG: hypothetical protein A2W94_11370 [Bacteroidetes bacterium GWE2_42_42]OFY52686.1 MAG: hypothetical protein A2W93_00120 [Bacteroidetes bacterium GWF2_43_63]HBG69306.1 hypothetical protein [Bacteroidales bacterium]HCB60360.1 hypothetical protein [Bacteroidales bacterium]HCY23653.1 hypothetical protein [Bacteroidales bacterium]